MFKIVIDGRTIEELRDRTAEFLAAMSGEETTVAFDRQVEIPSVSTAVKEEAQAHSAQVEQDDEFVTEAAKPPKDMMEYGVDSRGMPWDARIHSATQAKCKDGSWRTRRNVEPAEVARIETELRQAVTGTATPAPTYVPPVPMGNVYPQPAVSPAPVAVAIPLVPPMAAPSTATSVARPTAPPIPSIPAIPTTAHSLETFRAKMVETMAFLVAQGKLSNEYIQSLKEYFKVEQIWQVNDQQAAEMFETFCNAGLLTKVIG